MEKTTDPNFGTQLRKRGGGRDFYLANIYSSAGIIVMKHAVILIKAFLNLRKLVFKVLMNWKTRGLEGIFTLGNVLYSNLKW